MTAVSVRILKLHICILSSKILKRWYEPPCLGSSGSIARNILYACTHVAPAEMVFLSDFTHEVPRYFSRISSAILENNIWSARNILYACAHVAPAEMVFLSDFTHEVPRYFSRISSAILENNIWSSKIFSKSLTAKQPLLNFDSLSIRHSAVPLESVANFDTYEVWETTGSQANAAY